VTLISWPVARATVRERGLSPLTLTIVAVLMLLGVSRSSGDTWGAEAFSNFSWAWFSLLTLLLGAGLLADEVESGHAQLVLLRPLTRAQWVGGRLAGAAIVLSGAGGAAWLASFAAAIVRGETGDLAGRLIVLPLGLLPALGWLATLAALGAGLRGWQNAGALVAARAGWAIAHFSLPLALRKPELMPLLDSIGRHFGPQDVVGLARELHLGGQVAFSAVLWDVFWIFLAWLAAVRVFNLRELARRRA
jgi:hypothetical protein